MNIKGFVVGWFGYGIPTAIIIIPHKNIQLHGLHFIYIPSLVCNLGKTRSVEPDGHSSILYIGPDIFDVRLFKKT